jgi:phosphoesterase RecJ-like protein
MELQARAIAHVNLFADGKGAISYIRQQDIDETGAALDDAEGVIDFIKSVEGVEIAALLKEREKGIKVSMRAKSYGRVDEIALKFGGGGHVKAAGCTLNMSIDEAMDALQREMTKSLEDQKIDE